MIGSNKVERSSARSSVHAPYLVKLDGKGNLQYGQISHPAMVPAKAPFRTYVGWSSTLHGQSVWHENKEKTSQRDRSASVQMHLNRLSPKRLRIPTLEKYPKEKSMIESNKVERSSARSSVHAPYLVKLDGKGKLQYGQIGHPAMVPAKAPFRTYAGRFSTLHGQSLSGTVKNMNLG
ncbi:hypothetical protein F2Q69_00019896 [Brassica cretica]|uniref:Uncharacterized protein n=1 Tax=Brassica cretica TaxID=69181 RepID=A0A8S9QDL4_BRACR|nr:hypothetical protein F2Q69_00019896 [Brassica cretica]